MYLPIALTFLNNSKIIRCKAGQFVYIGNTEQMNKSQVILRLVIGAWCRFASQNILNFYQLVPAPHNKNEKPLLCTDTSRGASASRLLKMTWIEEI